MPSVAWTCGLLFARLNQAEYKCNTGINYLTCIYYWKSIQKEFLPTRSYWLINHFRFTLMQEAHSLLNFLFKQLPVTGALPVWKHHTLSGTYSSSIKQPQITQIWVSHFFFKCCFPAPGLKWALLATKPKKVTMYFRI